MISNKVIWFEGMFLQPQHFQQQDRHTEFLFEKHLQLNNPNLWGMRELVFDQNLLAIGKIAFEKANGFFADGTPFDIPFIDQSPTPLTLNEQHSHCTLYLALPLKRAGAADAGQSTANKRFRYQAVDQDIQDSVADSNKVQTIQVGSLATQLLTDHDDLSEYTVIPIAKLLEVESDKSVQFDKKFIASVIDINSISSLKQLLTELYELLNHRADALSARLTDNKAASTAEMIDFTLLQLINRYQPMLAYFRQKQSLHPELLFHTLIQLMGELATYTHKKRRCTTEATYNQKDLFNSFQPVIQALRESLSTVLQQNAMIIPLTRQTQSTWVGQIQESNMIKECAFVLSVKADLPSQSLQSLLLAHIKIAPVEIIQTLIGRALPGISINPLAVAPRQIPYHSDAGYFVIQKNHALWEKLIHSAGIALHIGHQIPGIQLELWAIHH